MCGILFFERNQVHSNKHSQHAQTQPPLADVQFIGRGTRPFRGGRILAGKLAGRFDTDPWLLFVFGLAGIVAGYRSIYRLHRRVQQDSREESGDSTSSTPNNG